MKSSKKVSDSSITNGKKEQDFACLSHSLLFLTWIAVSKHQIAAHRVLSRNELLSASLNLFRGHGLKWQWKRARQQYNE
jgi:hypothetical protein